MKELRLFLRKIDQKCYNLKANIICLPHYTYRYKTNEVLDHYKEQTPQKEETDRTQHLQYGCAGGKEKRRCPT